MGLLSFLKRPSDLLAPSTTEDAPVGGMRRRVRQRLMGALVLVGLAVVGFPLIFDSAPRPISIDIPIEIPARDRVAPLPAASATGVISAAPMLTETASEAGREVLAASRGGPVAPAATASANPATSATAVAPLSARTEALPEKNGVDKEAEKVTEKVAEKAMENVVEKGSGKLADKPTDKPATQSLGAGSALNAAGPVKAPQTVVEGASAPQATGRFVVQVGAFGEAASAREARRKLEKLGLKTYTQVVETAAGARTRVRAGPFADRPEAERAAAQIKQSGLPAALLAL